MKISIDPILGAFLTLRERQVRDAIYCRLVIPDRNEIGWLWRDQSRMGRPLTTQETFVLSLRGSTDVNITWQPMFDAVMTGDREAVTYAAWFFSQNPLVSGGTHITLDDFELGAAPWERVASDFFLIRCGSYRCRRGRFWRKPSEDARRWVESERFQVSDNIRRHVKEALSAPLPSGEWVTIRRVFPEETSMAFACQ